MNIEFKLINVAACSPKIEIGDVDYNVSEMISAYRRACKEKENIDVFVYPELCITGYSCADLFNQSLLINAAIDGLLNFVKTTKEADFNNTLFVVGVPLRKDNQLFNCAVYVKDGKVLGVVPKTYIPNYNEFYEKRWFASAENRRDDKITICNWEVPFTPNLIIEDVKSGMKIATDICEDLWMINAPSNNHVLAGANIICNLSASNEVISKHKYREDLVKMQSAKGICGYIYASAGIDESTTDVVFSGHKLIASNGAMLKSDNYEVETSIATIDIEKLENDRVKYNSFMGVNPNVEYTVVKTICYNNSSIFRYHGSIKPYPFVPSNTTERKERCEEIFDIQAIGLAQRMKKTGINKLVIGISGGLDSTLALLVCVKAMAKLGLSNENIIGITMPGFGTTKRTKNNSVDLMTQFGITQREVSIVDGSLQNFKDIGHDVNEFNSTYENVQARMRTLILMNTANKENALVVGTGDLSELALGWCTYNGDHMSMYAVNASIPKTLVKYLIISIAEDYKDSNIEIANTLFDICDTPISPELLPTDANGNMVQKTEESIGKYDLHDFFLYNVLRNGFSPSKIYYLAQIAFKDIEGITNEKILETEKIFYNRFFTQQFKRSCLPDGPKVGSVAVSPRGDLRMPSDACVNLWIKDLRLIENEVYNK